MTKAELIAIQKEAKAKVISNYVKFDFGYNNEIIFPFSAAKLVLEAFEFAETYNTDDYSNPTITPIEKKPEISFLSREQYVELKVKHLLGVNEAEENLNDQT